VQHLGFKISKKYFGKGQPDLTFPMYLNVSLDSLKIYDDSEESRQIFFYEKIGANFLILVLK
jgi:hypothetical protein